MGMRWLPYAQTCFIFVVPVEGKSMTISDAERQVRAALPVVRFFQTYMPLSLAG